jgi:Zn-dependent protease
VDRAFSSFAAFSLLGAGHAANVRLMLIYVVCLVLATAVHEFAHAYTADRLGDPTPGRDGRVTLNPVVHADPIGTVALPMFAGLTGAPLFGWGRPVMTTPSYYTRKISMRGGMALVSAMGPLSNLLQAIATAGLAFGLNAAGITPGTHASVFGVLAVFLLLNVTLAILNILPVHPLDGGKVLAWLLPARYSHIDDTLSRWGWAILLALMLTPALGIIFTPFLRFAVGLMNALVPGWAGAYALLLG